MLANIFEKIIRARILQFTKANNGIDKNQFGFLENSNTQGAVMKVLSKINKELDNGLSQLLCTLICKKRSILDHSKMPIFLEELRIRGVANILLQNYPANRIIQTYVNGATSKTMTVTKGVPQGSVLGPLLYLLYINNAIFADDTIILYTAKASEELEQTINGDMVSLDNWLRMNMPSLNTKKTQHMVFKQKKD